MRQLEEFFVQSAIESACIELLHKVGGVEFLIHMTPSSLPQAWSKTPEPPKRFGQILVFCVAWSFVQLSAKHWPWYSPSKLINWKQRRAPKDDLMESHKKNNMEKCVRCGAETRLYDNCTPVCLACVDVPSAQPESNRDTAGFPNETHLGLTHD
jgi:hypothetical protein